MTRRTLLRGCCLLVSLLIAGAAFASEQRMTPTVRAVQHAKASAINIHSEKTAQADTLFSTGKSRKVNGMGTGVVIDERGYIVTNHHVVKDVDSLRCTLYDGSTYTARVLNFDAQKDLAVIKIEASRPLPVMPLGTSSDLMLGESVIAIGNAYGYEHTITRGIVSSLSRDVEVNETQAYENLIQTDASINPGNSGGPLVNLDGEVIGINVAIRAGAQRIGFAIPIDEARRIIAELICIEKLDRNWHGLISQDVKNGSVRQLEVQGVQTDSPAQQAGLQPGDVVRKVGATEVVDGVDWERALIGRRAGEKVPVVVTRDGVEKSLTLTIRPLGPRNDAHGFETLAVSTSSADTRRFWEALGLRLSKIDLAQIGQSAARYRGGMKVVSVRPGGPADRNGIREGDVLVGLHVWETVNEENVSYVLEHPKLDTFNPLKFYILRGSETLYGHLRPAVH